jgi:hypothetical protein
MVQAIHNWFHPDKDPEGEIWPTVSIYFGVEGYLEVFTYLVSLQYGNKV